MSEGLRLVSVNQLLKKDGISVGDRIRLQGWVRTRRDSKAGLSFLQLHDGSCFDTAQVVAPGDLDNYESEVQNLTTGCSLIAEGEVVESEGKGQSVELLASRIELVGMVDDPETYPMPAKRHTFEYLREQAHLRVRTNVFSAMARVRHCVANAIHRYFHDNGFYWVHTPIITGSDCEGAGEMFRVSALDFENLPRTKSGDVDFSLDFFCSILFFLDASNLAWCALYSFVLASSNFFFFFFIIASGGIATPLPLPAKLVGASSSIS